MPEMSEGLRFRQIHLDFHTSELIGGVGEAFDAGVFARTLKAAAVDSVTCFARCHHGLLYYDTALPARHPSLRRNLLREQIEGCHAEGIRVPVYVSIGFDEFQSSRHPEWVEVLTDGRPWKWGGGPFDAGWNKLCLNNPEYLDYCEAQLTEVFEQFKGRVDGIFFDIILQGHCCCRHCLAGMIRDGLDPKNPADRDHYSAGVLARLKERLTGTVRRHDVQCTLFYNAGHVGPNIRASLAQYSHLELESLPSGGWGYDHYPITVRYAKNLGKEFLGMTGKFHKSWADFGGMKPQAALEYECFLSLAHGGGCSVGDQLHPNGAINPATYDLVGAVYRQVREKEAWCKGSEALSEIGVFSPEAIFGGNTALHPAIRGAHHMLKESHTLYDIIDGESDFGRYKVIILPDVITVDGRLKAKLEAYLEQGGALLASYESGLTPEKNAFALDALGVELIGKPEFATEYVKAGPEIAAGIADTEHVLYDEGLSVLPLAGTGTLAELWAPYFNRAWNHFCSHAHTPPEKASGRPAITRRGRVIYLTHPVFGMYQKHGPRVYRQLVVNCLRLLLPEKIIRTNAPTTADILVNRQPAHGRVMAHILHYIPERRSEAIDIIEDVIPLRDVELSLRLPERPSAACLAPGLQPLALEWKDGRACVTVPEVRGHAMVAFDY